VLKVKATKANLNERTGARQLLAPLAGQFPRLQLVQLVQLVWADQGYTGDLDTWMEEQLGWRLEIVRRTSPQEQWEQEQWEQEQWEQEQWESQHPRRDEAIVLLLLDTGVRSSELTGLKVKDIDLQARQCIVMSKGNKIRIVHFGLATGSALRLYLRSRSQSSERLHHAGEPDNLDEPLFLADKSSTVTRPLTRSGLQQLLERLGKAAGLTAPSCYQDHDSQHDNQAAGL
jgi:integrase